MKKILLVDDDHVTLELLREVFEKDEYLVTMANSAERALEILREEKFPVVLSDIRMLGMDGIELLANIRKTDASCFVILMTGFGNVDGAVKAIQEGAFDYISKPFRIQELKNLVTRAFKQWTSLKLEKVSTQSRELFPKKKLIGNSPLILEVYKSLARAALSSSSVLITGESGTGKELVAKAIHENSNRRDKKFVAINCGALSEGVLESELFGHVKGSFTGALADKVGLLEEADRGTLFLDEIGDVSPSLQVKLLRVLQEGEFKRVGSLEVKQVNIRVIAATHRNLDEMIKAGKFRDDLLYRLKVIEIHLPALRDRVEDLPELVNHFLAHCSAQNKKVSHISPEAMQLLLHYSWPGNVRELEHSIERAVAMCSGAVLFADDFPALLTSAMPIAVEKRSSSLEDMEKEHILTTLKDTNYNKSKTSEILGIDRATLYRKAQKYGIELSADR